MCYCLDFFLVFIMCMLHASAYSQYSPLFFLDRNFARCLSSNKVKLDRAQQYLPTNPHNLIHESFRVLHVFRDMIIVLCFNVNCRLAWHFCSLGLYLNSKQHFIREILGNVGMPVRIEENVLFINRSPSEKSTQMLIHFFLRLIELYCTCLG